MASPMENIIFYPLIYDSFSLFGLLQTLKLASDLTQGLLVIAWKEYHLNGTRIPKPRNYIKKKKKKQRLMFSLHFDLFLSQIIFSNILNPIKLLPVYCSSFYKE